MPLDVGLTTFLRVISNYHFISSENTIAINALGPQIIQNGQSVRCTYLHNTVTFILNHSVYYVHSVIFCTLNNYTL